MCLVRLNCAVPPTTLSALLLNQTPPRGRIVNHPRIACVFVCVGASRICVCVCALVLGALPVQRQLERRSLPGQLWLWARLLGRLLPGCLMVCCFNVCGQIFLLCRLQLLSDWRQHDVPPCSSSSSLGPRGQFFSVCRCLRCVMMLMQVYLSMCSRVML